MQVILKEDVANLGYKDDVVTVKSGYGRNYLIPQGKAVIASPSALKVREEDLKQRAHKLEKIKADALALAAALEGVSLTIGADRSAPRLRRVYPPHAVLQKIRAEEDVILKPQNMQNTVEAVFNLFRDRLRPMLKQIGVRDMQSIAGY